jgi:hypothetical protein
MPNPFAKGWEREKANNARIAQEKRADLDERMREMYGDDEEDEAYNEEEQEALEAEQRRRVEQYNRQRDATYNALSEKAKELYPQKEDIPHLNNLYAIDQAYSKLTDAVKQWYPLAEFLKIDPAYIRHVPNRIEQYITESGDSEKTYESFQAYMQKKDSEAEEERKRADEERRKDEEERMIAAEAAQEKKWVDIRIYDKFIKSFDVGYDYENGFNTYYKNRKEKYKILLLDFYNSEIKLLGEYKSPIYSQLEDIFQKLYTDDYKQADIIKCLMERKFAKKAINAYGKKPTINTNTECYQEIKKNIIYFYKQHPELFRPIFQINFENKMNFVDITQSGPYFSPIINEKQEVDKIPCLNFGTISEVVNRIVLPLIKAKTLIENDLAVYPTYLGYSNNSESVVINNINDVMNKYDRSKVLNYITGQIEIAEIEKIKDNPDTEKIYHKYFNFLSLIQIINVFFAYSKDKERTSATCVSGTHGLLRTLRKIVNCIDKKKGLTLTYPNVNEDDEEEPVQEAPVKEAPVPTDTYIAVGENPSEEYVVVGNLEEGQPGGRYKRKTKRHIKRKTKRHIKRKTKRHVGRKTKRHIKRKTKRHIRKLK